MKIQLETWTVTDLIFKGKSQIDETAKNSFDLRTSQIFSEQDDLHFCVNFNIKINDNDFELSLEAVFVFNTELPINEEFKISDFPKINAPAIAFPYLRAYISNLTLQSGFNPVILPSINFIQLAKEK